jgi:hypothetical protein
LWGDELVKLLSTASLEERSAYILMSRIVPIQFTAALCRKGKVTVVDSVHELGVFGTFIGYVRMCCVRMRQSPKTVFVLSNVK